jgi:hypothetical protein
MVPFLRNGQDHYAAHIIWMQEATLDSINFPFLMYGTRISGTLLSIATNLSWASNSRSIFFTQILLGYACLSPLKNIDEDAALVKTLSWCVAELPV